MGQSSNDSFFISHFFQALTENRTENDFSDRKVDVFEILLGLQKQKIKKKKVFFWSMMHHRMRIESWKKTEEKERSIFSWKWLSWGKRWAWFRTGFETVLLFLARFKKSVHVRAWVRVSAWVCARVSVCVSQWTEEISATDFINDPLLKVSPCRKKKWAR